ncbi:hypothetical protein TNCV_2713541 [Trichonephila clavipes]|nr:hypothetical protein TNCV_2713541 [Trichonephila clavipes]
MNGTKFAHTSPTGFQLFSAEEGIEWNFIPPASPISVDCGKRMKTHFIEGSEIGYHELKLTTLMAQIEAVLNSRPLVSTFLRTPMILTLDTGHFLTNCAISSFPEPYTASGFFVLSFQVETHSISERQILEPLGEHRIS